MRGFRPHKRKFPFQRWPWKNSATTRRRCSAMLVILSLYRCWLWTQKETERWKTNATATIGNKCEQRATTVLKRLQAWVLPSRWSHLCALFARKHSLWNRPWNLKRIWNPGCLRIFHHFSVVNPKSYPADVYRFSFALGIGLSDWLSLLKGRSPTTVRITFRTNKLKWLILLPLCLSKSLISC